MKRKVVTKEERWGQNLHYVIRKIGFYSRRQVRKGMNYGREISTLASHALDLTLKLNQAGK